MSNRRDVFESFVGEIVSREIEALVLDDDLNNGETIELNQGEVVSIVLGLRQFLEVNEDLLDAQDVELIGAVLDMMEAGFAIDTLKSIVAEIKIYEIITGKKVSIQEVLFGELEEEEEEDSELNDDRRDTVVDEVSFKGVSFADEEDTKPVCEVVESEEAISFYLIKYGSQIINIETSNHSFGRFMHESGHLIFLRKGVAVLKEFVQLYESLDRDSQHKLEVMIKDFDAEEIMLMGQSLVSKYKKANEDENIETDEGIDEVDTVVSSEKNEVSEGVVQDDAHNGSNLVEESDVESEYDEASEEDELSPVEQEDSLEEVSDQVSESVNGSFESEVEPNLESTYLEGSVVAVGENDESGSEESYVIVDGVHEKNDEGQSDKLHNTIENIVVRDQMLAKYTVGLSSYDDLKRSIYDNFSDKTPLFEVMQTMDSVLQEFPESEREDNKNMVVSFLKKHVADLKTTEYLEERLLVCARILYGDLKKKNESSKIPEEVSHQEVVGESTPTEKEEPSNQINIDLSSYEIYSKSVSENFPRDSRIALLQNEIDSKLNALNRSIRLECKKEILNDLMDHMRIIKSQQDLIDLLVKWKDLLDQKIEEQKVREQEKMIGNGGDQVGTLREKVVNKASEERIVPQYGYVGGALQREDRSINTIDWEYSTKSVNSIVGENFILNTPGGILKSNEISSGSIMNISDSIQFDVGSFKNSTINLNTKKPGHMRIYNCQTLYDVVVNVASDDMECSFSSLRVEKLKIDGGDLEFKVGGDLRTTWIEFDRSFIGDFDGQVHRALITNLGTDSVKRFELRTPIFSNSKLSFKNEYGIENEVVCMSEYHIEIGSLINSKIKLFPGACVKVDEIDDLSYITLETEGKAEVTYNKNTYIVENDGGEPKFFSKATYKERETVRKGIIGRIFGRR